MFKGPPCPQCMRLTTFVGVEPSMVSNNWVEAFECPEHKHRFEGPVIANKHDKEFKRPPYEEGGTNQ